MDWRYPQTLYKPPHLLHKFQFDLTDCKLRIGCKVKSFRQDELLSFSSLTKSLLKDVSLVMINNHLQSLDNSSKVLSEDRVRQLWFHVTQVCPLLQGLKDTWSIVSWLLTMKMIGSLSFVWTSELIISEIIFSILNSSTYSFAFFCASFSFDI